MAPMQMPELAGDRLSDDLQSHESRVLRPGSRGRRLPRPEWAEKSAIGLLEEVRPVDRAETRHVVVAGHGVDRETGGEVERSEDVGVTVAQGARVDPIGEVRPDNTGLVDVQDVMEGCL